MENLNTLKIILSIFIAIAAFFGTYLVAKLSEIEKGILQANIEITKLNSKGFTTPEECRIIFYKQLDRVNYNKLKEIPKNE